jgi:hypothetical protein
MKNCHTFPGADINSDHCLLMGKIKIQLKKPKTSEKRPVPDITKLKDSYVQAQYNIHVRNKYSPLAECEPKTEESINKSWKCLKESIHSAAESVLPKANRKHKQKWMTDEIICLMDERRKSRRKSKSYYEINRNIQQKCREAKEKWFEERCKEIEEDDKKHNTYSIHKRVKEITPNGKRTKHTSCVRDKEGNLIFEKEVLQNRWCEYIQMTI